MHLFKVWSFFLIFENIFLTRTQTWAQAVFNKENGYNNLYRLQRLFSTKGDKLFDKMQWVLHVHYGLVRFLKPKTSLTSFFQKHYLL